MGRCPNKCRAIFAQQQHRDGRITRNFLRHAAQQPLFHPGVPVAAHDNQVDVLRLGHRKDRGGGLTYDHFGFSADAYKIA